MVSIIFFFKKSLRPCFHHKTFLGIIPNRLLHIHYLLKHDYLIFSFTDYWIIIVHICRNKIFNPIMMQGLDDTAYIWTSYHTSSQIEKNLCQWTFIIGLLASPKAVLDKKVDDVGHVTHCQQQICWLGDYQPKILNFKKNLGEVLSKTGQTV